MPLRNGKESSGLFMWNERKQKDSQEKCTSKNAQWIIE